MATMKSASVKRVGNQAARQAKRATQGGLVEGLERWGYVARGVLYIIMGGLAVNLALGAGGAAANPVQALRYMAGQPYGKVLLVGMLIGLAGYTLWGLVRAVFDPLARGSDANGLLQRAGYLISSVSYGTLVLPAVQLLMNPATSGQQTGNPRDITAQLMTKPYGVALVYAFGLFWLVAGMGQFITAYRTSFMRDLKTPRMSATERKWARIIGRIGYAARGVVYGMLGVFVVQAASQANPQQAQGIDGVLIKLAQGPYGQLVLGSVAAGLLIFGIYSVLGARWYSLE